MKITIRLLGNLRQYLPHGTEFSDLEMEVSPGAMAHDIPARLSIPADAALMILLNDVRLSPEQLTRETLKTGDRLVISPAIKGG